MKYLYKLIYLFGALLISNSAFAFHIGEHGDLTQIAVKELNLCLGGIISDRLESHIEGSNKDEDWNIFKKWFKYSHYFNPLKPISISRKTSLERIQETENSIFTQLNEHKDLSQLTDDLGVVVHHIQDMAVPAHVVPISHWIADGFESYTLDASEYASSTREPCAFVSRVPETPQKILIKTAIETLKKIYEPFQIQINGKPVDATWEKFWKESKDDSFGTYGDLEGHFGSDRFTYNEDLYQIPEAEFKNFKVTQGRLAIEATKESIYWLYLESNKVK